MFRNEKTITHFSLVFLLGMFFGCSENDTGCANADKIVSASNTPAQIIDYKPDTYAISISEHYKLSGQLINWRWSGENDPDSVIDSNGIDTFYSLSEPLVVYYSSDYLPALHIQTTKNIITSFSSSILFSLSEKDPMGVDFLRVISTVFTRLQNDSIVNKIVLEGIYVDRLSESILESYKLTKTGVGGYDVFEYNIKIQ